MTRPTPASLQELPPRWAHLCLDVEGFALTAVKRGDAQKDATFAGKGLVLACSGGADSTALLHLFACLRERTGCKLVAAHLDHGLRRDSTHDARFVAARAAELGVAFHGERVDVAGLARERGLGIEEAGRLARYDFLERTRREFGFHFVLTAHHLDDLTEDVLMRLMRGTGWPGLAGMPAYDPQRRLLRPLMETDKATLNAFLTEIHATWREDETNQWDSALRNRVRRHIIPMIVQENPGFPSAVSRLWNQGVLDQDYWEEILAQAPVLRTERGAEIRKADLDDLHPAMRLRLYKKLLDELGTGQVLARTLFDMDAGIMDPHNAKPLLYQFPGGKAVRFVSGRVIFSHEGDLAPQPHPPRP